MPDQQNITNIPSNRVEFIDSRTGLVSREWYRFFLNLFNLAGAGSNQISLDELQIGPPPQPDSGSGGGGGGGSGTVTSVQVSGGTTGLTTSGGPITSSGTITIDGTLDIANGGTGATTAAGAPFALKGANADITSMSGITGGISSPDYIDFDTTAAPARATGRLWWDNADGIQTLNLGMAGSNATMQIGEEMYFRIKASAAITEGQVVMFTGTVGASGALQGAPATGLTATTAQYVMGVATESIALNGWGYVTQFGLVRGIDTSGGAEVWADGDILYYDPTVTGGLTKTLPSAPNAKVVVAAVIYASASNGSLFVRPAFGGELGQYEGNVGFGTLSNGDLMQYDSGAGKWTNVPSSTFGTGSVTSVDATGGTGISVSGGPITTSGTLTITNTAPDQVVSLTQGGTTTITGTYPNFTISSSDAYTGTVTSVATAGSVSGLTLTGGPITSSGTITLGGTLAVTPSDFASQTANTFLAAPNGSAGTPSFRAIVAADVPTLNQNTTGTADNVTGTVAIANGGTGQTSQTAAFDALSPTTTKGDLIVSNGTDNVRLAVGTDAYVLTADAASAAGVKWAAAAAGGSNITTKGMWENALTISSNYTITSGNSAMSAGPITIASGVSVTVPSGSRWVVV